MDAQKNLLRKWSPSLKGDVELKRIDEMIRQARDDIQRQKDHGRQMQIRQSQEMDALETRQVTLTEILRRMEQELKDKDVYEYGDVLAEIFGERKIFAARAIGLESLLCQLMHQMLAKQHQLKIMKRAGKDIQSTMKKHKMHYNDQKYSYEALAVQLEVSRLNMEAIYDEVFTSQHRILALLKNEKPMANPNIRSTNAKIPQAVISLPVNGALNKRHASLKEQQSTPTNQHDSDEDGDYETAMAVLSTPTNYDSKGGHFQEEKKASERSLKQRREDRKSRRNKTGSGSSTSSVTSATSEESSSLSPKKNRARKSRNPAEPPSTKINTTPLAGGGDEDAPGNKRRSKKSDTSDPHRSSTSKGSSSSKQSHSRSKKADGPDKKSSGNKSARERRRQIEQMRLGRVVGGASTQQRSPTQADLSDGDSSGENKNSRDRMRELEELAKKRGGSGKVKSRWPPSKSGENGNEEN